MVKIDAIIKSNRRSLSIVITQNGEVVVHAPKRLSMDHILTFVNEKSQWIQKKQNAIQNKEQNLRDIINYKKFLFLGKEYELLEVKGLKKVELTQSNLLCPQGLDKQELIVKIIRWYIKNSKDIISERIEYLADLMQLDYSSIKISNTKNRWGSCDSKGNIKINFRVILLKHNIIDYVLIHELSHLVEFNHSKNFYKVIESVMPNWETARKELKDFSKILELFR